MSNIVTVAKNPELDYLYGIFGGEEILTNQDRFKPVDNSKVRYQNEKDAKLFEEFDFYIKKKGKNTYREFEERLRASVGESAEDQHPYLQAVPIEVVIVILMQPDRFKSVDVDNLAKSILDCFKGIIFEDDSQVVNLLTMKRSFEHYNGLIVGVRKLDRNTSWFDNIKLLRIIENDIEKWLI